MEQDKKIKNIIAETYAEDMAKILENDTAGLVKKIIHGEEQHEAEKRNLSPESKKNKVFVAVSILLIISGLAIISFLSFNKKDNSIPVEQQFTPIIFNDKISYFEVLGLKKEEIVQTILNQVNNTSVKTGGLEGIYLTKNKRIIGLREFISLIKARLSLAKDTFLVSDNFLMGVVNNKPDSLAEEPNGFFVLIKVRSTADIFNALREWEGKMLSDIGGLVNVNLSSSTNYLFTKDFEDGIVENKNARILYDKDGKIVLMYIFTDENSVLITNSANTAHEIMLRLTGSQKKK